MRTHVLRTEHNPVVRACRHVVAHIESLEGGVEGVVGNLDVNPVARRGSRLRAGVVPKVHLGSAFHVFDERSLVVVRLAYVGIDVVVLAFHFHAHHLRFRGATLFRADVAARLFVLYVGFGVFRVRNFSLAVGILTPDGTVVVAVRGVNLCAALILVHVAVHHVGVVVLDVAYDAAHKVVAPHGGGAHEVTLRDGGTRVELTHDAANLFLVGLDDALEGAGANGGAHVGLAGNAAHVVRTANAVAQEVAVRHVAVFNVTYGRRVIGVLREKTYDETEVIVVLREERGVRKREVRDGTVLHVAEETRVFLILDGETVDGVTTSVEHATEGAALGADGGEVARARHVDVAHEARLGGGLAAVHLGGKLLEVGGRVEFVVAVVLFNAFGHLFGTANGVDGGSALVGGVETDAVRHSTACDAHGCGTVFHYAANAAYSVGTGDFGASASRGEDVAACNFSVREITDNAAGAFVVRHHVAAHRTTLHDTLVGSRTADAAHHVPLLLALERDGGKHGVAHMAVAHGGARGATHDDCHLLAVDVLGVLAVVERDDGVGQRGLFDNHVLDGGTVGASEESRLGERANLQSFDHVVLSVELAFKHVAELRVTGLHAANGSPARVGERGEVDVGIESTIRAVVTVVDNVGKPLEVLSRFQSVVTVGIFLSCRPICPYRQCADEEQ